MEESISRHLKVFAELNKFNMFNLSKVESDLLTNIKRSIEKGDKQSKIYIPSELKEEYELVLGRENIKYKMTDVKVKLDDFVKIVINLKQFY